MKHSDVSFFRQTTNEPQNDQKITLELPDSVWHFTTRPGKNGARFAKTQARFPQGESR